MSSSNILQRYSFRSKPHSKMRKILGRRVGLLWNFVAGYVPVKNNGWRNVVLWPEIVIFQRKIVTLSELCAVGIGQP